MDEHLKCIHEQDWGSLWALLKTHTDHVIEGEKVGGARDRLLRVEIDVKNLKERFWQSSLIGAVIGTLIGSGSKEAIGMFINWLMKK